MSEPVDVQRLLRERDHARATKDFARADTLRAQIERAGFTIRDTPTGAVAEPRARLETANPATIPNSLSEPPTVEFSFNLLYEGFREDVQRFLEGFSRHNDTARAEIVIVDNASPDGDWLEGLQQARILHLDRTLGWAAARNAGLKTSRGEILVLVDLSIEPTGDMLTPLRLSFQTPSVGIAGPFGLVSADMRSWDPSEGPDVDAVEGYLLATRRAVLADELICEKFKWYRNADIDLSLQIRSKGRDAVAVPLPVIKHVHRGWEALDEAGRARLSKRNHYILFDRWKHRMDLLLSGGAPEA